MIYLNDFQMREKLKQSAKSTNFWNNLSTIISSAIMMAIILSVKDAETQRQILLAFLGSSGVHNAGNILAHVNKD